MKLGAKKHVFSTTHVKYAMVGIRVPVFSASMSSSWLVYMLYQLLTSLIVMVGSIS